MRHTAEEKADAIGLSGLLVKSAQQMVLTAQDLRTAGIDVPIIVGGAALTRKFTKNRIRPEYDGMVAICEGCDGWSGYGEQIDESRFT